MADLVRLLGRLAEERISAAMTAGDFDGLPGSGLPLRLEDESSIPGEWRLAFHLLRSHGFAPAWIETRGEIQRKLAEARDRLAAVDPAHSSRPHAQAEYAVRVRELNRQIARYNLQAPGPHWHLIPIDDAGSPGIGPAPATAPAAIRDA